MKEKQISSKLKYECFFMKLFEDEVLLPNQKTSKRIYIKHDGASAVLPITKDGKIILVKQFRYPINQISIEIPAGKKDDPYEDGIECAKRELEEETGYQSTNITKVMDTHNCVGYSDELIELFIALDCEQVENKLPMDEDEFIELLEVSVDKSKEMISSGEITDAKTIIMLQHYYLSL